MTLSEFFRKARRGRTWEITENGQVVDWDSGRMYAGCCPLGAVMGDDNDFPTPAAAARDLGLAIRWTRRIAAAADNPRSKHRKWLLKNLGVRV